MCIRDSAIPGLYGFITGVHRVHGTAQHFAAGDLLRGKAGCDDAIAFPVGIEPDAHIGGFSKGVEVFDVVQAGALQQAVQLTVVLDLPLRCV